MPGCAPRSVRTVLVHERRPVRRQPVAAELEESPRNILIAEPVQRLRHESAVARPHVRVVRAGRLHYVGVVRGNDRATVVDLRAYDEQTAADCAGDLRWQSGEPRLFGLAAYPGRPVTRGLLEQGVEPDLGDPLLKPGHIGDRMARAYPGLDRGCAAGRNGEPKTDRRVDRSLLDRIHRQRAVLRVAPRPLRAAKSLDAGRVLIEPVIAGPAGDQ